jgi:putative Holliday junction resolvase
MQENVVLDKDNQMGDKTKMRFMGLDIGSRTIGVAISDELGITAQGLKTIRRTSKGADFEEITKIINEFQIGKIVVGLPKNMDGTLGKQAETVLQWVRSLKEEVNLPVETWDERLSTVEASKVLLEADVSRRKRKKAVDKLAAVIILQGYMDRSKNSDDEPSS